jgi:putative nucleotidyltransferase with HDIG domain
MLNDTIFDEITDHLLDDDKPSDYINQLSRQALFSEYPLKMIHHLKKTEQSKVHHPEGSVWNHTMMVLDEAAAVRVRSKDPKVFMWAALLHDIGKPDTTRMRRGRITSYDHDVVGEKLASEFLRVFTDDEEFIKDVSFLVRYHMHMLYVLKKLPYADVENLIKRVNINELSLLCRCDRMGRTGVDREAEEDEYQEFLSKLEQISKTNINGKERLLTK